MDLPHNEKLDDWRDAMIADGISWQTVRDMTYLVIAVAAMTGVSADRLTDINCDMYSDVRNHKPSTRKRARGYVRRYRRFLVTGVGTRRGKAPVRVAELTGFRTWLQEGRYSSTRRNGARRMREQSALAYGNHVATISAHILVHPSRFTDKHVTQWLTDKAGSSYSA